jgi:hypothetical protein
MHLAPDRKLEPETFYWLKHSAGLYLDCTDVECALGVTVNNLYLFVIRSSQKSKSSHCYLEILNSHILVYFSSCLHTCFPDKQKYVIFMLF